MPKAVTNATTLPPPAQTVKQFTLPPMIPLPSVLDLVSRIRALSDAGEDGTRNGQLVVRDWLDDQEIALRGLVATMPAATLADAAAQLYVAMGVVEFMEDFKLSEGEIGAAVIKLRRMIRSILPVVAEAAGLSLDAIAGEGTAEQCAAEFPELATRQACSGTGRAST